MRLLLFISFTVSCCRSFVFVPSPPKQQNQQQRTNGNCHDIVLLYGWVQQDDGEWEWEEDDPDYVAPTITTTVAATTTDTSSSSTVVPFSEPSATPQLPGGSYKPKQSLGQNYLKDPNTVSKILRAFHEDATRDNPVIDENRAIVELGPGAGALTDKLVEMYGAEMLQCIEIDKRSVELLNEKHPNLRVRHEDVLQVNYPQMAAAAQQQQQSDDNNHNTNDMNPLVVIGNLPYYITSQILFALADASHSGSVYSATVTMQWEVAQRMVAKTCTKDYGILSVVFQLYCDVNCHFKIPPTVFYPQPKVDSALVGLHFIGPDKLQQRLAGVRPIDLRRVVTTAFRQRRKTIRNSLKKLVVQEWGEKERVQSLFVSTSSPPQLPESVQKLKEEGDLFAATQELPSDWAQKRPEQLTAGQFIELTRLIYNDNNSEGIETIKNDNGNNDYNAVASILGKKVWRKLKHGQ